MIKQKTMTQKNGEFFVKTKEREITLEKFCSLIIQIDRLQANPKERISVSYAEDMITVGRKLPDREVITEFRISSQN